METTTPRIERTDLPSMMATLCLYESWFGPHHSQTLHLLTELALAFWQHGDLLQARPLLERAARDCGRKLGRDCEMRIRVLATLRELLIQQGDSETAAAVQKELVECCAVGIREAKHRQRSSEPDGERVNLAHLLLTTLDGPDKAKVH